MGKKNKDTGTFVLDEFIAMEELTPLEAILLSLYKFYSEDGNLGYCCMTNETISKKWNISERHIRKMKQHLKELGLIDTDGGIIVKYIGHRGGTTVPDLGTTVPGKVELQFPHNNNNKNIEK